MGACWAAGLSGFEMGGASTSGGLADDHDEDIDDRSFRKHPPLGWSVSAMKSLSDCVLCKCNISGGRKVGLEVFWIKSQPLHPKRPLFELGFEFWV